MFGLNNLQHKVVQKRQDVFFLSFLLTCIFQSVLVSKVRHRNAVVAQRSDERGVHRHAWRTVRYHILLSSIHTTYLVGRY